MASQGPPSSQSTNTNSMIFLDSNGQPIQIYVDPGGIHNRPNLVRKIRNAGAVISYFPNDARIILVDSTNDSGRQLIRNWANDPGRNVLEYSWASSSITAGKPLLEKDDFGGWRAYDDGRPIETDTEAHTGIPTPPPTDGPSSSARERSSTRRSSSQSLPTRRDSFHHLPPEGNGNIYNSNPFATTNGAPSPPPQAQQFPPPPSSSSSFQSQEYPHYPMSQNIVTQMNPQMAMSGMNQPPNAMISMTHADLLTLVDIVRHQSMPFPPWTGQVPTNTQQPNMQPFMFNQNGMMQQPFQSSQFQQAPQNPHHGMNNPTQPRDTLPNFADDYSPQPPSPQVLPPSIRRRSSPSIRSKGKGKEQAEPHTTSFHRKPSVSAAETPGSSSSSFHSPSPPPKHGSPRKTGHIFTSETGAPLLFFVQVDLRNRASVVNKIKKNGGKITGENLKADYVILYSGSDSYGDLIRATIASNKVALNATFVDHCVDEGLLLDEDGYILEHSPTKRKRGRPASLDISDTKVQKKNERQRQRRREEREEEEREKRVVEKNPAGRPKKSKMTMKSPARLDRSGSPSPPPPRLLTEDKYSFTEEERSYVLAYVKRLMQRDHLISNTGIGNKLYQRMSHHSIRSWNMYVSKTIRAEIEEIRKRVGIAHRLATSAQSQDVESPSKRPKLNNPTNGPNHATAPPPQTLTTEQEDLDVICNFFASGRGNDEDDELVWENLTKHKRCKTVAEWPEFYKQREELINDRIRMLLDETAAGEIDVQTRAKGN